MKTLLLLLFSAAFASAQVCGQLVWNPVRRHLDCIGAASAGSGITSLNALTGATQTFATPGTTGTAPNWVSSGTAHTLHIPLASAAGVTLGGITKAFYDTIVINTRTISTTSPLGGGGDLSANRTFTCTTCATAAASLTSTAIVTGAGSQGLQTPAATATMDASGNIQTPGTIKSGVGGSVSGAFDMTQGTDPGLGTSAVTLYAPTSVTSYRFRWPAAAATGFLLGTNSSNDVVASLVGFSGTGDVARVTSPAFTTPALGTPSALVLTNATGLTTGAIADNGSLKNFTFGATFDGGGSALTAGTTVAYYVVLPYACTIKEVGITVDAGTATFKLWRIASGTAIPTVSNSISTSGIAISSGTALITTTTSDFTDTTLDANDILGINLSAVATATKAGYQIRCQK